MGVQGEGARRRGVGALNSDAVKRALEEFAAFNEGSEIYYVEERQRILDKIAEQRKGVREERARGVFSRDGNEPTLAQYRLLRLGTMLRSLRRDETQFHRRRAEEEKEIEKLGLVAYLKVLDGHKTFGPDTYRILAEIVDPEGYRQLLVAGLSDKDMDVDMLCTTEKVVALKGRERPTHRKADG